jgi:hypothetical protein
MRPVVEIGAQGDDEAQRAARRGQRSEQAVEEEDALALVFDQGKELLKLVDDEQELGMAVGGLGR